MPLSPSKQKTLQASVNGARGGDVLVTARDLASANGDEDVLAPIN